MGAVATTRLNLCSWSSVRIRGSPGVVQRCPLLRGSPDVARVPRCDDGGVGTTVLIVDDHQGFRAFARALLETGGFEVVGEAVDGASALAAARALKPALVLLDVQLPDIDGFSVCEQLAGDDGPPVVVLTSTRDASSYRRRLGDSSARGFIAKADLSGPRLATFAGAM